MSLSKIQLIYDPNKREVIKEIFLEVDNGYERRKAKYPFRKFIELRTDFPLF